MASGARRWPALFLVAIAADLMEKIFALRRGFGNFVALQASSCFDAFVMAGFAIRHPLLVQLMLEGDGAHGRRR